MKLMFSTAAIALLAISAPAAAQYENASRAAPPVPATTNEQPSAQQAQQDKGPKPSKQALKPLLALQTAVNNKDAANIPALVAAAQAAATTKEDRYLIGRLQLRAAIDANNTTAEAAAVDAIAASGLADQASVAQLYKGLGGTFYNAKQYSQAIAAFTKATSLNASDFDSLELIGESYLASGQKAQAAAAFQHAIQARSAAGQKAEEDLYKKAVQLAYDAHSPTATEEALKWATRPTRT